MEISKNEKRNNKEIDKMSNKLRDKFTDEKPKRHYIYIGNKLVNE